MAATVPNNQSGNESWRVKVEPGTCHGLVEVTSIDFWLECMSKGAINVNSKFLTTLKAELNAISQGRKNEKCKRRIEWVCGTSATSTNLKMLIGMFAESNALMLKRLAATQKLHGALSPKASSVVNPPI